MKLYAMRDSKGALHEDTVLCEVHYIEKRERERIEELARKNNPEDQPIAGTWQEITDRAWDCSCVHAGCDNMISDRLPRRTSDNYRLNYDIGSGLTVCTDDERFFCKLIALAAAYGISPEEATEGTRHEATDRS